MPDTNSKLISPIAAALAEVVSGIAGLSGGIEVKGIKWAPRDTDARPAGVVELPELTRTAPDEAESQLGSEDWRLNYPVVLYFDLDNLEYSQEQAAEVIEALMKAIRPALEAGQPLAPEAFAPYGVVQDGKLTSARPEFLEPASSAAKPTLRYVCQVELLVFSSI